MENVEKDVNTLLTRYLHTSNVSINNKRKPKPNYNHTPHPVFNWNNVSDNIIMEVDKLCMKYKYMRVSIIIKRKVVGRNLKEIEINKVKTELTTNPKPDNEYGVTTTLNPKLNRNQYKSINNDSVSRNNQRK